MSYWNKGAKKYLISGSDQHNVTSGLYPGIIRTYAHVDGDLTTKTYLQALKAGVSYVTMGPIITPAADTQFGSTQKVTAGKAFVLAAELQAVNGLRSIEVISEGKVVEKKEFNNTTAAVKYTVSLQATKDTWHSFIIIDGKGRYAVTNPTWVKCNN